MGPIINESEMRDLFLFTDATGIYIPQQTNNNNKNTGMKSVRVRTYSVAVADPLCKGGLNTGICVCLSVCVYLRVGVDCVLCVCLQTIPAVRKDLPCTIQKPIC